MIDSTHPNFKQLNKALKDGNIDQDVRSNGNNVTNDMSVLLNSSGTVDGFNDSELKELLKKKDRRGRPRKFPVEETGVTIKGLELMEAVFPKPKISLYYILVVFCFCFCFDLISLFLTIIIIIIFLFLNKDQKGLFIFDAKS